MIQKRIKSLVDEIDAEIENEIASLEDSSNENNDTKED